MGIETAILAGSALLGTATSAKGLMNQKKAQKQTEQGASAQNLAFKAQQAASVEASQASLRGEQARERQMKLDSKRSQRQLFREAQVASALARTRASNAGAGAGPTGFDSAVVGGAQQVASQRAFGTKVIGQNLDVGGELFKSSYDVLAAQIKGAEAGTQANIAGNQISMAGAKANQGQALFGLGVGFIQNAPTIASVGTSLFTSGNSSQVRR